MKESNLIHQDKAKKEYEIKTFPIPFTSNDIELNININTLNKEQILNKAFKFHSQGNTLKAAKYYQYFIDRGFKNHIVFSNYGNILRDYGKFNEAEKLTLYAIKLKPDYAEAYSNLGLILNYLGKYKKAEISLRKAIQISPNYTNAYYNLGTLLIESNRLKEAESNIRKAISLSPDFAEAHNNLGKILIGLGNLKEAELSIRKAISLKNNFAEANSNLGKIYLDLGKLQAAESSLLKAIKIDSYLTSAYYSLSKLNSKNLNSEFKKKIFSSSIINNNSLRNKIDIFFARANIRHQEKNYKDSAKYLQLGNNLKLKLKKSNYDLIIKKSKRLLIGPDKKELISKNDKNYDSIFIVGMPRSGSTLIESIISMNTNVHALGEINILQEAFLEWIEMGKRCNLSELYWKKANVINKSLKIITNKYLYNYQYVGIILNQIPKAKIIHCFRNPLDNILSIYRANFTNGNEYSSSLVDCTKVYLDQEKIMTEYKKIFRSKIYDINYDSLVSNPDCEIQSLIAWFNWEWNESYLSPHLNSRPVSTASNIQVRSPINSKSINGWKNYKEMLKPAIELLINSKNIKI